HRDAVDRAGHAWAVDAVDRVDHARDGGEVVAVEVEGDVAAAVQHVGQGALDRGAIGDAPGAGDVHRHARAVAALGAEATDHQVALGDGVDLAVGALPRRHHPRAPTHRDRVPD